MKHKTVVAITGNPNSGKTTIFNQLTGARQHVANYPGVTVERKEGYCRHRNTELKIVDLPGTYSLTAYSAEELVAREFIINEKPDVVIDIIDASNLERNLYLAVQLIELDVPLVLVFNMSDVAKTRGFEFDLDRLSSLLGSRIVETVGNKGMGMNELLDAVLLTANEACSKCLCSRLERTKSDAPECNSIQEEGRSTSRVTYGKEIEEEISSLLPLIKKNGVCNGEYDARWLAVKLLENDAEAVSKVNSEEVRQQLAGALYRIENSLREAPETAIASARYSYISRVCKDAVRSTIDIKNTVTDRIDSVVTNRILGIPIFLAMMYLVFQLTFTIGDPPMGWIESFFGWLSETMRSMWSSDSDSLLMSLLIDGVIGGVGGVLVFLPNILLLFLAIAVLEDSGYMARAAFIMDRILHKIGLHGKSFIPMLIGFGCSVPAIMATRTLENHRDRLTTMLVVPLMSCGARLPIYALIIPAFFPQAWYAPMLWLIYIIGILLAIASAKLIRSTILKGESVPFVMELPPYRLPTLKGVLIHMWERGWLYLKKAGTVILAISILLWAMTTFPAPPDEITSHFEQAKQEVEAGSYTEEEKLDRFTQIENEEAESALRYSFAGRIGNAIEPLLKPMGFDWKIGTALIGAFAAKEVFVAQLGIVYSVGEADEESETLRDKLKNSYSPLIGFCIMLFCLISAPCMATIAITKRESNSWRWALLQLVGLTMLAYVITVLVFQLCSLFSLGL